MASGLTRLGYKKGDVALIFCGNCPEYTAVFLGCGVAGITVSTANPVYTPGMYFSSKTNHTRHCSKKSCFHNLYSSGLEVPGSYSYLPHAMDLGK